MKDGSGRKNFLIVGQGRIPAHIYESLLEPVTDMGGGLVRLHNGKVYKLEDGQQYHTPRAVMLEGQKGQVKR